VDIVGLSHISRAYKMIHSWKLFLVFSRTYRHTSHVGPSILLLSIYPREKKSFDQAMTCTQMFITGFFITAKPGNDSNVN
jgi:hypothetical protein